MKNLQRRKNGLEKINDENDKLEKRKKRNCKTRSIQSKSTLDSLNNQASSTSQSTLTLTSGTYAVGENIKKPVNIQLWVREVLRFRHWEKARVNSNLTADGKDYVLNDDETIKKSRARLNLFR